MAVVLKVQLAHGSSFRYISGFENVAELYERIAESFQLHLCDILFCTVNTHKPDVNALLVGTINENDLVFVHLAGETLEVEAEKTSEYIGVTITDNANGNIIVKHVHHLTAAAKTALMPGDVILTANGRSMKGMRHCEASAMLRAIPLGSKVQMEVIRPFMDGFSFVCARTRKRYGIGQLSDDPPLPPTMQHKPAGITIRFALNDGEVIRCSSRFCRPSTVISLNAVLDSYFGFHDDDLAVHLWHIFNESSDFRSFCGHVHADCELRTFGLPDEILRSMWMILKRP